MTAGDDTVEFAVITDDPPAGVPVPGLETHVTGTCGHPVDAAEWDAGYRTCEGCAATGGAR